MINICKPFAILVSVSFLGFFLSKVKKEVDVRVLLLLMTRKNDEQLFGRHFVFQVKQL